MKKKKVLLFTKIHFCSFQTNTFVFYKWAVYKIIISSFVCFLTNESLLLAQTNEKALITHVNPFVGTDFHGHTYPGAMVPFGMVQLSPDTRLDGWDGCSAYHYSDSVIHGFSHTHLSGTGCSDYGDILFMPLQFQNTIPDKSWTTSSFSHKNEYAEPGYYRVFLDKNKIKAELTVSQRCGMHRYTFKNGNNKALLIDLEHRDEVIDAMFEIIDSVTICGYRKSKAWARNQQIFFYAVFSNPFDATIFNANTAQLSKKITAKNLKAILKFKNSKNAEIIAKVGISFVDVNGAKNNYATEVENKTFDAVRLDAQKQWEQYLHKIVVTHSDTNTLKVFYTALYHTALSPNIASDCDGRYLGMDLKIHQAKDYVHYTVFSLWDTYRALHPLFTIIERNRTLDFIKTFLNMYLQAGKLPVWELAANETNCMIGYHAVSVIADAYAKGIQNFNTDLALQSMLASANIKDFGIAEYAKDECLLSDKEHESVSKTLEYAYNDWCIAQFAKAIKRNDVYKTYTKRALSYQNLFHPTYKFMVPRVNGGFLNNFDPREVNNHYTEANSWQYSFYVPHDIQTLIDLHGGDNNFEKQLDALFNADSKTTGRTQVDITGLIGQYAHGNEPSHQIAYLYNYIAKPWKTQLRVSEIMEKFYTSLPDGLAGNEDCGQMSAWYVLSSLGFYPVCPGNSDYAIGMPQFEKAVINMENGKSFIIETKNQNAGKYIHSATLNGSNYEKSYFTHQQLMDGGTLVFNLSDTYSEKFGTDNKHKPSTQIENLNFVPMPYFINNQRVFKDSLLIDLADLKDNNIYYQLDSGYWQRFEKPFFIYKTCTIKAYCKNTSGNSSAVIEAKYNMLPKGYKITLLRQYNPQYNAGGAEGLLDGIYGTVNWRLGNWQGYQNTDFIAIVELDSAKVLQNIGLNCLQDARSWIWMPVKVNFYSSMDGVNFIHMGTAAHQIADNSEETIIYTFKIAAPAEKTKYIKIEAINYGDIPAWHPGAGGKAFIFADEIIIN